VLTRNIPAKPLAPPWTIPVLRVTGPIGAALGVFSPLVRFVPLRNEPVTTFLIMVMCQGVALAGLAAMLRFCQAIEARTVLARGRVLRPWISWVALGALAIIWALGYWFEPIIHGRMWEFEGGDWGGVWAMGFLLLYGFPLWR